MLKTIIKLSYIKIYFLLSPWKYLLTLSVLDYKFKNTTFVTKREKFHTHKHLEINDQDKMTKKPKLACGKHGEG